MSKRVMTSGILSRMSRPDEPTVTLGEESESGSGTVHTLDEGAI